MKSLWLASGITRPGAIPFPMRVRRRWIPGVFRYQLLVEVLELDLVKGSVRWSLPKIDNYENYDHVRGDNVSFGWDSKRNMAFISVNALVKSRSPIEHTLNLAMDQLFENGAFDHAGKLHRAMVDEAFRSLIDHGFDPSTDFYEKLELVGRYYMMIEGKPYTPETEVNYDGP